MQMLDLNSILLFSEEPEKLAAFYQKVFRKKPEWEGDGFTGFKVGNGFLSIGAHDKVKGSNRNPERLMFNLETEDVDSEFQRIVKLGAQVIAEPYQASEEEEGKIATFADPDGNYFQLMSPMEA
jgi:predicted enzyme related to lactoylglutathione lyase